MITSERKAWQDLQCRYIARAFIMRNQWSSSVILDIQLFLDM